MPTRGVSKGPGGSSKAMKSYPYSSKGPGGSTSNISTTTNRGYESSRFQGLRSEYKESGRAENSKASKKGG